MKLDHLAGTTAAADPAHPEVGGSAARQLASSPARGPTATSAPAIPASIDVAGAVGARLAARASPAAAEREAATGVARPAPHPPAEIATAGQAVSVGSSDGDPAPTPFEPSRRKMRDSAQSSQRFSSGDGSLSTWPPEAVEPEGGAPAGWSQPLVPHHREQIRLSSPVSSAGLGPRREMSSDAADQARLTHSLFNQLETIGQEVRDIRIFHFISHHDQHTVRDMRRAVQWVSGYPDGVGRVSPEGIEGRWPDEMDRLPKLAIALGLERLKLSGRLDMPTFEHEDTNALLGQVRTHLNACLAHEHQPLARLQERLMRHLVGADGPWPSHPLHALRLSVEELAARPRHNQRDYVAMAIELALDDSHAPLGEL